MIVIAIDGPAASGKSSVSKRVAHHMGFSYVNSGTMYRAITWELLRQFIDLARADSVESALDRMAFDSGFSEKGESYIRINSQIPDLELRESEVNAQVSSVSAIPAVRRIVSDRLRALAEKGSVVMEGRDIGTAVFPHTPYKFYLDASPDIRRRRRAAEGQTDSIERRDKIDSTRSHAPLQIAPDAYVLDTSHLTLEDVVQKVIAQLETAGISPA
jgi:cytidylate kinase